ncbi:MAG: tail fiber domain-containing protein, partial [Candidatus Desantisbacteria bacterium]
YSNTTGFSNSSVGMNALYHNTEGHSNSAMGKSALYHNITGDNNTAIGSEANYYNQGGSNNTIIGYQAGRGVSGHIESGNVFLGYQAGYSETGSNKLYIENSSSSSPLIYGEFGSDIVTINGTLSVGVSPYSGYRLTLPNTANALGRGIANAWSTYSSRRWKENIRPIENALEKVKSLRGVYFDWKENGKHDMGMIAEEVGEVIPEIVDYEENGTNATGLDYSRLVAVLIEAVKAQQAQIESQQERISILEEEIEKLKK